MWEFLPPMMNKWCVSVEGSLVEQDVVLRAHAQVLADGVHVCVDVQPVDEGGAWGGREQPGQDGPIGGGSIEQEVT